MVLLQILYHRITGRPLFRAAPLHRWLEKRGLSAVNIFYSLCAPPQPDPRICRGAALPAGNPTAERPSVLRPLLPGTPPAVGVADDLSRSSGTIRLPSAAVSAKPSTDAAIKAKRIIFQSPNSCRNVILRHLSALRRKFPALFPEPCRGWPSPAGHRRAPCGPAERPRLRGSCLRAGS